MSKFSLDNISFKDFLKLRKQRENLIDESSAERRDDQFPANALAHSLHPASLTLTIETIQDVAPYTKKITFISDKSIYFEAGSYISIMFNINNNYTTRPYSISSSPQEGLNQQLEIIVKEKRDGLISHYLCHNVHVGDSFKALAPEAEMTYEPLRDSHHVIGIAGGSGITPFLSLGKAIVEGSEDFKLTILYGVNTFADIIEKDTLDRLTQDSRINVIYVLAQEEKPGYVKGYISQELIQSVMREGDNSFFICGPEGLYQHILPMLEKWGIRKKFIRFEPTGDTFEKQPSVPHTLVIHQNDQVFTVQGNEYEPLLVSLEKAGLIVPSKCRVGICGYCHTKVIKGSYRVNQPDKRRMADIDYNYIHICSTYPLSDMELIVPRVK